MLTLSRWTPLSSTGRHRGASTAIAAIAVGAAIAVHFVIPTRDQWLPKCPFHELTGLWCPGCGSTRAACALSQGNVFEAFRHNVLFLPALATLVWVWSAFALRSFAPSLAERSWTRNPLNRLKHPWYLVAVVLAFWVVRNIPGAMEHLLSS
ncbi:MAG TPA: DUF2752 domain-containing protein [Acidimicrobiales bacterium]|jgi:hypothetical protein|nr:DUF2752 domain-containing protein [Acidimicrobiales bacterium]